MEIVFIFSSDTLGFLIIGTPPPPCNILTLCLRVKAQKLDLEQTLPDLDDFYPALALP